MSEDRGHWLDNPRNVRMLIYILYVACGFLLAIDFYFHKHVYFGFEEWTAFYAWYSFLCGMAVVLAARFIIRPLVRRGEDYYGD